MLSKAEEATAQVQQLLEKSLEKWLPNWMEKRYEKVSCQTADCDQGTCLPHALFCGNFARAWLVRWAYYQIHGTMNKCQSAMLLKHVNSCHHKTNETGHQAVEPLSH